MNNEKRTKDEFESFKKRILSSKSSYWFESLSNIKKFMLFREYKKSKYNFKKSKKSFSLRKFIFNKRKSKMFSVPLARLRDSVLNKILN